MCTSTNYTTGKDNNTCNIFGSRVPFRTDGPLYCVPASPHPLSSALHCCSLSGHASCLCRGLALGNCSVGTTVPGPAGLPSYTTGLPNWFFKPNSRNLFFFFFKFRWRHKIHMAFWLFPGVLRAKINCTKITYHPFSK